jgi:polyisoprenoid-binding protein YceI
MRLSSLALPMLAWLTLAQPALASNWDIDPSHSEVGFSVRHMMVSNTRGRFGKFTGTLALDDKDITKSTVNVEIDTTTIATGDAKRDEHLKSPEFLDTAKFPKITFKSTKVEKSGDKLNVTGDLTIRDVTKSVLLTVETPTQEVKDPWGTVRKGAKASTTVKRKDFGLTWNKALEAGGIAVGEDVTIQLEVELVKHTKNTKK